MKRSASSDSLLSAAPPSATPPSSSPTHAPSSDSAETDLDLDLGLDVKPDIVSPSPKKSKSTKGKPKTAKPTAASPKMPKTPKTPKTPAKKAKTSSPRSGDEHPEPKFAGSNGTWTDEKRAGFIEDVLLVGYKNCDLDALAVKYGMTRTQLSNQLTPGRNNLRSRVIGSLAGGPA